MSLMLFQLPTTINRWFLNGVLGSNRCFQMQEGGLSVLIIGDQNNGSWNIWRSGREKASSRG